MRNRWLWGIAALAATMLACDWFDNLPFRIDFDPQQSIEYYSVDLVDMVVDPASGSGSYTLTVKYDSMGEFNGYSTHYFPGWVTCYYTTPDGASFPIGDIHPPNESKRGVMQTASLPFSVTGNGDFTATCTNHTLTSTMNKPFINTEEATPTATLTLVPTLTATLPTRPTLIGKIIFDYAAIYAIDSGYELKRMADGMCAESAGTGSYSPVPPEITITPDGEMSNTTCKEGHPAIQHEDSTFTSQLTGTVGADDVVEFEYEIYEYGPLDGNGVSNGAWHVVISGQGVFTTPTHAAGVAIFNYSCDNDSMWNTVSSACGVDPYRAHYGFSGESLPWSFDAIQ